MRPIIWKYSEKIAEKILEGLENGLSLKSICQSDDMPSRATVHRWFRNDENFEARCAQARARGQDVVVDSHEDIEAEVRTGALDPQAARVILSSMQWRASKLAPKKYGDRLITENTVTVDVATELMDRLAAARRAKREG